MISLTVVVVGHPAGPQVLRVVVVGQRAEVVVDVLEHQVARDLVRSTDGRVLLGVPPVSSSVTIPDRYP